jgi:hypothetical protein
MCLHVFQILLGGLFMFIFGAAPISMYHKLFIRHLQGHKMSLKPLKSYDPLIEERKDHVVVNDKVFMLLGR